MQDGAKSEVLRRLKSVEGHVRGVAKMVENEDVSYADVVQQTNAIFSAIRRINTVLLKDFVEERAEQEGASEDMVKDLVKAIDRVVYYDTSSMRRISPALVRLGLIVGLLLL